MPLVIEPLDVPAPSEPIVPEVIHPDDKILWYRRRRYPIQLQRWNGTWRVKGAPNQSTAMLTIEDTFLPAKILFRQQRAQPFTRATRKNILSWNSGPRRRRAGAIEEHIAGKWHTIAPQRSSTFNTSASRTTLKLPISLDVLSCSTRTLFTRTSKFIPSTSTTLEVGSSKS